jgi:PPOX class probable F420-dependent enzyme
MTTLSESHVTFLTTNHSAAMITVGADGRPKVARVGVALIDGKLWSSGTADRARTARVRRDPRCTLYVYDATAMWLAFETMVKVLDGPDVPELSVRLFRVMQGQPTGPIGWFGGTLEEADFRRTMVEEKRVIYEFDIVRSYGLVFTG